MRNLARIFLACLTVCMCAAENVYLKLDNIPGEVTKKGLEGQIEALAFNHEIVTPRDAATGLPSGRRQHQPLKVVMRHEKSFPLLLGALIDNTAIPNGVMSFWRPNFDGTTVKYMTYEFKGLRVVGVRPWMPNQTDAEAQNYGTEVEVTFTYQSVTWTFVNGGITSQDTWGISRTN